jgi:tripartite-type tricarboxylate transporter receptor subunit TctC
MIQSPISKAQMRLVSHHPGGGCDNYARLMGKHITAYPRQSRAGGSNMPGGGGLRAVNFIGNVARRTARCCRSSARACRSIRR